MHFIAFHYQLESIRTENSALKSFLYLDARPIDDTIGSYESVKDLFGSKMYFSSEQVLRAAKNVVFGRYCNT